MLKLRSFCLRVLSTDTRSFSETRLNWESTPGPENCTKTSAIVHTLAAFTGLRPTVTKSTALSGGTSPRRERLECTTTMKRLTRQAAQVASPAPPAIGSRADKSTSPRSRYLLLPPAKGGSILIGTDEAVDSVSLICASQLAFVSLRCARSSSEIRRGIKP